MAKNSDRTAEKGVDKLRHGNQQRRKREMGNTKKKDRRDMYGGKRKKEMQRQMTGKFIERPSMEDRSRMGGR